MISNSSPPRTTPLTPLNNSPFSRGSRAVHQGQKKAKAYNISIAATDFEIMSGLSKDGGNDINNGKIIRSPGETSPNQVCDPLTPISKGILKRKREDELEIDDGNGATSNKKKVIFANPISATKLIESRKNINPKTNRKRRLRYEDQSEGSESALNEQQSQSEPETVVNNNQGEPVTTNSIVEPVDIIVNNLDTENSDPVVESTIAKQAKLDGRNRKSVKIVINPPNDRDNVNSSKDSINNNNQLPIESNVNLDSSEKISEHSNNSNTKENGGNENSDDVFSEIESLLKVIESPCANKSSSSSNRIDPGVVDDVIKENQIEENNNIEALLIENNTKSNNLDDKVESESDLCPIVSPNQQQPNLIEQTTDLNEPSPSPSPPTSTSTEQIFTTEIEEIEETAMEVEESIEPASKPLLESWVNAKKSVDLFIQSYCNMLTSKMRNWLSVKGINTIGDFANLVGTSSNRLTESPICPLNEETILSTFQFMIDQQLNMESDSVELDENIKDSETISKINELDSISVNGISKTKLDMKKFSTLKVVMPILPLELSSKINNNSPDTPSSDCSGTTIELSSDEESSEIPVKMNEKLTKSSSKDEPKKSSDEKISLEKKENEMIPKKTINSKGITSNKETPSKSISKNDVTISGKKKVQSKHEDSTKKDTLMKESANEDLSMKNLPVEEPKNHGNDFLSTLTTKSSEFRSKKDESRVKSKPRIDPTKIVPRAAIVIKRLTNDEIIELSKPKIINNSVENSEIGLTEDKGDNQTTESISENKTIEDKSPKVQEPQLPPPLSKDDKVKGFLNVQDDLSKSVQSPSRKLRRKRDSELSSIPLPKITTRTRRRTVGVKFD
ncbi:TNF receptor-associated factor family protein DDB_G0272098-like isoform X2 [Panonychus citri]|uniref:TNF receptor-associated factor family protein DDB_G0272098-like isoform X2 n=1 Tax=Panonychus citri TaxID=50023 RepID=UPI00230752C2|nr:TNF receptor-associated factor family protein DDB_G0272098-like isoform X2 [Panonychus citri]